MEKITSRQNNIVKHFRKLSGDRSYRRSSGEYVCEGMKLLREALELGVEINTVLWSVGGELTLDEGIKQYVLPSELVSYTSSLKDSPGPLFTVPLPLQSISEKIDKVIILDGLQDAGNVDTIIRTAAAFSTDVVILTSSCTDPFGPKTVRAAMGAHFRIPILEMGYESLSELLRSKNLSLYGAALGEFCEDIREMDISRGAVAVGSEGSGLSGEIIAMCDGLITIPMRGDMESLNAAIAASIILWEMSRRS